MNNFWECSKNPNECSYRFDYRGCIKKNCPFPYEYEQKERYQVCSKWKRYTQLQGYDFTFVVNSKYFYAKEIYKGYGMACFPVAYVIYRINEEEYNKHLVFSALSFKEEVKITGTEIYKDEYYLQFVDL